MDVKGVLIDLDGVMYVGDRPVPGADEAIRFLDDCGYPFRFVSNTTRKSRKTIAGNLARMGLDIPERVIFTPAIAAAAYIQKSGKHRCFFLLAGDAALDFGPACSSAPGEAVDFVVVGDAGENITYENMNSAFRSLLGGAELIALEKDRYWMAAGGLSLSAGPFVTALEYAAGKTATVVGKPSGAFFTLALEDMGLCPAEAAMIGDDIGSDIGGAQALGMRGILVRTGKFRKDVLQNSRIQPDRIIGSIADLPRIMEKPGDGLPRPGTP